MASIDPTALKTYADDFKADTKNRLAESALTKARIHDLVVDPDVLVTRSFKHQLDPAAIPMTDQQASGRCWIFAFTNLLRRKLIKHYKLAPDFQLSQKFVLFYDRLEKCNALMEVMYFMSRQQGKGPASLEMVNLRNSYLSDGGTWAFFTNVVLKYGIVPQEFYTENRQSQATGDLATFLAQFLEGQGTVIDGVASREEFEALKERLLHTCYNTMLTFLGMPPAEVLWKYTDAKGKVHEPMKQPCSPQEFYRRFIKPVVNIEDFVVLINDPRHPYDRMYSVELLHNVLPNGKPEKTRKAEAEAEADLVAASSGDVTDIETTRPSQSLDRLPTNLYMNVPVTTLRESVYRALRNNTAVPFAADAGAYMRAHDSRMDVDMHYEDLLGYSLARPKKDLYRNLMSGPNHAMLFIATNGREGEWQVENSWGVVNKAFPYLTMTDAWFENYVGEIVVHKRDLPPKTKVRYNALLKQDKITFYKFWDVFGGVARPEIHLGHLRGSKQKMN
jgi:bleomycin hydrolase